MHGEGGSRGSRGSRGSQRDEMGAGGGAKQEALGCCLAPRHLDPEVEMENCG